MSYKDQHHSNQVSSSIRVSGYNCDTEIQWPYHWRDPSVVSIHAKRDQHINQCNSQQSKLQNRSLHSENSLNSNCISYACKRKPLFRQSTSRRYIFKATSPTSRRRMQTSSIARPVWTASLGKWE